MTTVLVVLGLWSVLCVGFVYLWCRFMEHIDPNGKE